MGGGDSWARGEEERSPQENLVARIVVVVLGLG